MDAEGNRTVAGPGDLVKITFMQRGLTVYRIAYSHEYDLYYEASW